MESKLNSEQLEPLRKQIHSAVDRVIDEFLLGSDVAENGSAAEPQLGVTPGETTGEWTYRWPDGAKEVFFKSRWYVLNPAGGGLRVRVAWTRRPAWGRHDRVRAVVFHQIGTEESNTYYPWVEFVETDDGRYAAPIPDPRRPRAMLSDLANLPSRFTGSIVERSDQVFTSIAEGPSLRLVVDEHEEIAMVEHGFWVAVLRNRI